MKPFFFYLGMGFIATHELDAVTQHEWRLLYVLRALDEPLARDLFVALHVPLFAALIWITHHRTSIWREPARLALMAFLVIHVGLHWRLSDHALCTFHSPLSWGLILGGGICGAAYLALTLRERRRAYTAPRLS